MSNPIAIFLQLFEELFSDLATLGFGIVLAIVLGSLLVGLAIVAVYYVIYALGIYRIAKQFNLDNAFLAWIPFAQYFTLGQIAEKCDEYNGSQARPWGKIVLFGSIGAVVASVVLNVVSSLLSIIPILGLVIGLICSMLTMVLSLAPFVLECICRWKICRTYFSQTTGIILFIVGVVCNAQSLITLIASFCKPAGKDDDCIENVNYTYNS